MMVSTQKNGLHRNADRIPRGARTDHLRGSDCLDLKYKAKWMP
ncbi:protein of unknown function [Vibrio tapetis subsp. tapetis]|uniref:Uncharacterized protein n=1 Tax=Vibrio tapetis subsp. tapetis TaxID=1671868 RepID=A0A2N8ZMY5_9VIBR|nr:protein of unknown function [Vibrio tapetis subsp. tapetis]